MSNRTGIKTGAPAAAAAVRLALSYQVSHALYVATRLGIWDLLAAEVCTISEIASRAGTHVQSMLRLLRALAAFDLVRDVGAGRFELTLVGECLTSNSTSSVRPLVLMYGSEHARQMFGHLEQCIATGRSAFEIAFGAASGFSYLQGRPDFGAGLQRRHERGVQVHGGGNHQELRLRWRTSGDRRRGRAR